MEVMEGILLKPGQSIKPFVPSDVASSLVQKLYNLEITSIKELNSYDDKNFHIMVKDPSCLPDQNDACPHGYILKVLNSLDSKASHLVEAQNEMMLFLGRHGIPCPKPVKNIHGSLLSLEELKTRQVETNMDNNNVNNQQQPSTGHYIVRLLTYIPGEIFFNVPYTSDLFYQVGEMVAKTDLALMGFEHEGLIGVDRIWNLSSVPKLGDFVYAVPDENKRALAHSVIGRFKSHVVPHYGELAHGSIHGDMNEQNILVQKTSHDKYTISGILDFGDIHHNFYVFEIAIAICYMMIECHSMDILDVPGHVLAGYNKFRPLPELEFSLLKDCICGRFCQSLVLGAYSYSQNPDPYLLTTSKRGWLCLEKLWNCPEDQLHQRWRAIIQGYNDK